MRVNDIVGRHLRKKKRTTIADRTAPPVPDLVMRDFTADTLNTRWCGDITYVAVGTTWLYLATVIDICGVPDVFGPSLHHQLDKLEVPGADHQRGHGQRSVGVVVRHVLVHGGVHAERCGDRLGRVVRGRIDGPALLADAFRIEGESIGRRVDDVPEAAGEQLLGQALDHGQRIPPDIRLPVLGEHAEVFVHLGPVGAALPDGQLVRRLRVMRGETVGDHRAHVRGGDVHPVESQASDQFMDVLGHVLLVVAALGLVRVALSSRRR